MVDIFCLRKVTDTHNEYNTSLRCISNEITEKKRKQKKEKHTYWKFSKFKELFICNVLSFLN